MDGNGFDLIDERLRLSQALLAATAGMARSTEPVMVFRTICDALPGASARVRLAWMVLGELDTPIVHPEYAVGPAAVYAEGIQISRESGTAEQQVVRGAIRRWESTSADLPADADAARAAGLRSVLTLPLGQAGRGPGGLIVLYADRPDYFQQVGIDLFQAFVHLGSASLEQAALLNNLTHLATHDLLTGVLNRRGIQECMERELARSQRHQQSFAVLLFDIDRFKLVNYRLGHREGDVVLRCVADAARAMLRNEDYLGRWGGEEFICVVPATDGDNALNLAERIRRNVRDTAIRVSSGELQATVSVGVAAYPADGESLDKLIATADSALYQAKRSGRDRVVCASRVQQHVHSMGNMLDAALRERRIVAAFRAC